MRQKMGPAHWAGFVLILIWCLLPVAWIVSLSFKSIAETTVGSPQFLPKDATWDNYKTLLDYDNPAGHDFLLALRNSFGISIIEAHHSASARFFGCASGLMSPSSLPKKTYSARSSPISSA